MPAAGMRFVPVKTEAQQIVLSLHRLRAQLMKTRIMQTNELRGLLYAFGIVLPQGHAALLKALPEARCDAKTRLPAMLMDSLDEQLRRIQQPQVDTSLIERRLSQLMREIPACKAVAEIPGVGLLLIRHGLFRRIDSAEPQFAQQLNKLSPNWGHG